MKQTAEEHVYTVAMVIQYYARKPMLTETDGSPACATAVLDHFEEVWQYMAGVAKCIAAKEKPEGM